MNCKHYNTWISQISMVSNTTGGHTSWISMMISELMDISDHQQMVLPFFVPFFVLLRAVIHYFQWGGKMNNDKWGLYQWHHHCSHNLHDRSCSDAYPLQPSHPQHTWLLKSFQTLFFSLFYISKLTFQSLWPLAVKLLCMIPLYL